MNDIFVTGTGPSVGKTVVSAILVTALQADYWKPVQCGKEGGSDTETIKCLTSFPCVVHSPVYALKHPVSPHHAARLSQMKIDPTHINRPKTSQRIIVETAGGILVPWNLNTLTLDYLATLPGKWIVVSKHYLGSINHTLLTLEVLKQRKCDVLGLVFNGESNPDTEEAILTFSQLPCLGRLYPEKMFNPQIIKEYAKQWKHTLL